MQARIHGLLLSTWHMPGRLDLACASGLETQRKRAGACVHSGELACSRGKWSDQEKRQVSLLGADRTDKALEMYVLLELLHIPRRETGQAKALEHP